KAEIGADEDVGVGRDVLVRDPRDACIDTYILLQIKEDQKWNMRELYRHGLILTDFTFLMIHLVRFLELVGKFMFLCLVFNNIALASTIIMQVLNNEF
ncbi:unnamed protein product, partial [Ilex paraguariensis]